MQPELSRPDLSRPDLSWLGVLEHHARRTPTKPLAVHGDRTVTYAGMQEWSSAVAGGLAARGVRAGDVVALLSHNNLEFLATIFAANHLGAVAMPINWRLAAPELRFILEHSGARALVCGRALVELADAASTDLGQALARVCVSDDAVAVHCEGLVGRALRVVLEHAAPADVGLEVAHHHGAA